MKFKAMPPLRKISTPGSRSQAVTEKLDKPNTTPWPNQARTTRSRSILGFADLFQLIVDKYEGMNRGR
jgi:hypothetical protein